MQRIARAAGLLLTLSAIVSCSSEDPAEGNTGTACRVETVSDDPSFRAEILPIFQGSCTFSSSCHGDKNKSQVDLYLGKKKPNEAKGVAPMTDQEVTEMLAGIVDRASMTAPAVNVITAGDANASFLMHKLDGTQTQQGFQCEAQESDLDDPCGDSMPQTASEILCQNERDTIRNWINAGAKDN
ncbi:MAG: hypothetical protein KC766_15485 [Myxococcales bacterium]|nr:hypothetical protein [Myxococcales bacterium]